LQLKWRKRLNCRFPTLGIIMEDRNTMINSLIVDTIDWKPLPSFESRNSKKVAVNKAKFGTCGVYLVTTKDKITDDIINADIGYVGKSSNIFNRVYDIRGGDHGARKYINSKNINPEDVYVKILFTEESGESYLEKLIHEENQKLYGSRFAWKEASAGTDGILIRIFSDIEKIDNEEELKQIADFVEEKAISLYRNSWRNK
jgi:hypothetical protein